MRKLFFALLAASCFKQVAAQNVGIGTTTPATKLHIVGNSSLGVQHIRLEENENDFARLGFHNSVNTKFWDIAARSESIDDNSVLNIYNSSTGNLLSIIGNGNVGIGNTNPVYKLDVAGRLRLKHSTGTAGVYFDGVTLPTRSFVGTLNDDHMGLWGSGSGWNLVMNVNNGNIGIGNQAPEFPLNFSNATGGKISFWNDVGNNYGIGLQPGLLQIHTAASADDVAFGYGSSIAFTETMRIKGNGRVGIGTSTPTAALDVYSSSGNLTANYNSSSASMYTTYSESGTVRGYIGSYSGAAEDFDLGTTSNNTTGKFHLTTQATPKMTIDNTGNVGIGTTTPGYKLDVNGRLRIRNSSGTAGIYFDGVNTPTRSFLGTLNEDHVGIWGAGGAGWNFVMNVNNGNIGIGNTTPQSPLSFANNLGSKVAFWTTGTDSYGIGLQSNLLQIHSDFSGSDIAFGYGSSAAFTENLRIKGNGNTGIGTSNPNAKLEVNGFTKMGSDAPAIKTKFLTRTITAVDGTAQSINHGLYADQILSLTVHVTFTSTEGLPSFVGPNYTGSPGYEFTYNNIQASIRVFPIPGNSSGLLNQTMKVFIVYKDL